MLIWQKVLDYLGEGQQLSQFSPIFGNREFGPGRADLGFKLWSAKGLAKVSDLFIGRVFMSFTELKNKHDIPTKHFYKYLQVRSFILSKQQNNLDLPPLSSLEDIIVNHLYNRGQVSLIYSLFVDKCKESPANILKAWEADLGGNLSSEEWSEACTSIHTQSANTNSKLLQYKWLTRQYITPVKLHHFNPNIPDTCIKCTSQRGSLFHCMWACPRVLAFWKDVLIVIGQMIGKKIPLNPKMCILNIYPEDFVIPNNLRSLLNVSFLEAKRCIALSWKKESLCGISQWTTQMTFYFALEKISYFTKNKLDKFWVVWSVFYTWLCQNDIQIDGWKKDWL